MVKRPKHSHGRESANHKRLSLTARVKYDTGSTRRMIRYFNIHHLSKFDSDLMHTHRHQEGVCRKDTPSRKRPPTDCRFQLCVRSDGGGCRCAHR